MKNREVAIEIIDTMWCEKAFPLNDDAMSIKGERAILFNLSRAPSDITAGELANRLGVSTARIASALNSLELKKQIIRKPDPQDKRKVYVALTSIGQVEVAKEKERFISVVEKLITEFGEEKIKEHIMLISRIKRIMEQEHLKEKK